MFSMSCRGVVVALHAALAGRGEPELSELANPCAGQRALGGWIFLVVRSSGPPGNPTADGDARAARRSGVVF